MFSVILSFTYICAFVATKDSNFLIAAAIFWLASRLDAFRISNEDDVNL